jgi:hypothetical protein
MKKIITTCLLLSSGLMSSAFAANTCTEFHLQISNLTPSACVLTSYKAPHGSLITPPPMSILPNDSKRFDMAQNIYGPVISLSYQCGAENITFTSSQGACIIEAGDINGAISHPLPTNLNASFQAIPGSSFWGNSGSINWEIVSMAGKKEPSVNLATQ